MITLIVAGLTVGSTYALVALGMHLILRAARIINFAQGEFVVLGGLIALTSSQVFGNPWFALAASTIAGFVIGVAFDLFVLRPASRRGDLAVTIVTIGAAYVLLYGHALIWGSLPQPLSGFTGAASAMTSLGPVAIPVQSLWVFGLLALALVILWWFSEHTLLGKAAHAAADNPFGACLIGIDVDAARALHVGLAIALAAYAGTIIGPITLVGGAGGTAIAIKGFIGAIVGGMHSAIGCTLGGLAVGLFEKAIESRLGYAASEPVVYGLLIAALILLPRGIFGSRQATRD